MAIELVTGYAGSAHISAADDGQRNVGTFGAGKYVLDTGDHMDCEVVDATTLTIGTGDALFEGRHIRIAETQTVSIDNGAQSVKRNDIVCIRYQRDTGTGVESAILEVIKGTAGSTAVDPTIPSGSILEGSTSAYMPLWRIPIDGIAVGTPEKLYGDLLRTLHDASTGSIAASRIDSGTISASRLPSLGGTYLKRQPASTSELPQNTTTTAYPIALDNTFANGGKVTYMTVSNFRNALGLGDLATKDTLSASDIPNISASKITSGTLAAARVPSLDASKISSGTFDIYRIPTIPWGWIPYTTWQYLTGSESGNYVRYCKWGVVVCLEVYYSSGAGLSADTDKTFGTLPTSVRPTHEVSTVVYGGSSHDHVVALWVTSGGVVKARSLSAATSHVYGTLTYMTGMEAE